MATKNRPELVEKAINSVINQDYDNFELIIINDGSTDNTLTLLQSYQEKYQNIHCYHNKTSFGVAQARNQAIKNCSGDFITGLDDDDCFQTDRLSSLMANYDDKYSFICSSVIWDFGHKQKIADNKRKEINLNDQLNYNHATTQVLVKKARFDAIGCFDHNLVARIDYDAWTRLIEEYGCALRIANPSYILNRSREVVRITTSERDIKGNHQFLAKHKHKMSAQNLLNHEFRDIYARNDAYTFKKFLSHLAAGYIFNKFKYYVRINFLKNWHN